ncbi:hypothetical protein NBRC116187_13960 [Halopseudomonas sabulinigri]|uniref:Uncharacterized protein n=1 Tax=Halopseudomonas sabulinigri TaxID=472181 RepID=A0ABP9ZNJ7_9GAMM
MTVEAMVQSVARMATCCSAGEAEVDAGMLAVFCAVSDKVRQKRRVQSGVWLALRDWVKRMTFG